MDDSEAVVAFLTLAEVGVGFVGFAGIVLAITRPSLPLSPGEALQVREVIRTGLAAVALALFPTGVAFAGIHGASLWRGLSALHVALTCAALVGVSLEYRRLDASDRDRPIFAANYVLALIALAVQFFNVTGWVFAPGPSGYFVGVLMALSISGVHFGRLLFSRLL